MKNFPIRRHRLGVQRFIFFRISTLAAVILASLLVACATPERKVQKIPVLIESDPPGARIEVNEGYVGTAPCTVEFNATRFGTFAQPPSIIKVRATPASVGYTQTKTFIGVWPGIQSPDGEPVPKRMFFDTSLGPVTPDLNVNVLNQR
jgi:hypothetical protein